MKIDRTLYKGRPSEKREPVEERCYDVLDELNIEYYRADHSPANTIDECHGIEEVLGHSICKNLFLSNRQETDFYLLLLPGDKPFKTKILSRELGVSRLSFGKEEYLELMSIKPGSVSVLGVLNDRDNRVRLLIDREVYEDDYICCHPCRNTSTLKIKTEDVVKKIAPYSGHDITVVDLPWETE